MKDLKIPGNPGWVDTDAADADVIVSAISHGGSVASITMELFGHDGSPRVEVGSELTAEDCRAIASALQAIAGPTDAVRMILVRIRNNLAIPMTPPRQQELAREIDSLLADHAAASPT